MAWTVLRKVTDDFSNTCKVLIEGESGISGASNVCMRTEGMQLWMWSLRMGCMFDSPFLSPYVQPIECAHVYRDEDLMTALSIK